MKPMIFHVASPPRSRMPAFDLRTVILMSSVMPGLMALVMFSLGRGFRQIFAASGIGLRVR
jgi:hypothetical protein